MTFRHSQWTPERRRIFEHAAAILRRSQRLAFARFTVPPQAPATPEPSPPTHHTDVGTIDMNAAQAVDSDGIATRIHRIEFRGDVFFVSPTGSIFERTETETGE